MTDLHPVASTPDTCSRAAAEAAAADQALSRLVRARGWPHSGLPEILTAGFEAITHGLLAAAVAIEDSGADTADAVTDLGERLATVDDTLSEVATRMEDAVSPVARWRLFRRWGA